MSVISNLFQSLFCDDVDVFYFNMSENESASFINLLRPQSYDPEQIEIESESPLHAKLKKSLQFKHSPTLIKDEQKESLILIYYDTNQNSSFLYELESKQTLI